MIINPYRFGGGVPPFNPDDIPGLFIDLDPDAIVGLSDGDPVGTFPDVSSSGYDFTQTGSARPIYKPAAINGHALLRYDGIDDCMERTNVVLPTDCTIIAVTKKVGSDLFIASTGGVNRQILRNTSTPVLSIFDGIGNQDSDGLDNPNDWSVSTMILTGDGTFVSWWENGVSKGSKVVNFPAGTIPPQIGLLCAVDVGVKIAFCESDYARFFGYDSALGTTDREMAESGIGALYGITITH